MLALTYTTRTSSPACSFASSRIRGIISASGFSLVRTKPRDAPPPEAPPAPPAMTAPSSASSKASSYLSFVRSSFAFISPSFGSGGSRRDHPKRVGGKLQAAGAVGNADAVRRRTEGHSLAEISGEVRRPGRPVRPSNRNVAMKTHPSRVEGDHRKASSRTTPAAPFAERTTVEVDARARLSQKVYTHDG